MYAPRAERLVDDALPSDEDAAVKLVVEAFVAERSPVTFALPSVAPCAERLVVDAFTTHELNA